MYWPCFIVLAVCAAIWVVPRVYRYAQDGLAQQRLLVITSALPLVVTARSTTCGVVGPTGRREPNPDLTGKGSTDSRPGLLAWPVQDKDVGENALSTHRPGGPVAHSSSASTSAPHRAFFDGSCPCSHRAVGTLCGCSTATRCATQSNGDYAHPHAPFTGWPLAGWHARQICLGSSGFTGQRREPDATVRGANRTPHSGVHRAPAQGGPQPRGDPGQPRGRPAGHPGVITANLTSPRLGQCLERGGVVGFAHAL